MRDETAFDRYLWTIVLTAAVVFVVFSFARSPLSDSDGAASAAAEPLMLWVTGGEASGEIENVARQAAGCWQMAGEQANVGVLPGDSVEAVSEFLNHTHGSNNELLLLTSSTLSEIAYEALRPPGSPAHERAQVAARRLLEATPVVMLGGDSVSLAVRSGSSIDRTGELLAMMRADRMRRMMGVADEAWLEGSLASLAQSAGVEGAMPFDAYRSTREAIASLDAGEADAIVAPHSALAAGLRAGALRQLAWPRASDLNTQGWVAIMAPSGLDAGTVASLRSQAGRLCKGDGWRERLRQDGLRPEKSSPTSLRRLIPGSLSEANRLQALAAQVVRNY